MSPATTLVLHTLRESPPITTIATSTSFSPIAPAPPTASNTAAPVVPEFPRTPCPFRATLYWAAHLPARPTSLLLRCAHVHQCRPAPRAPHRSRSQCCRKALFAPRSPRSLRA